MSLALTVALKPYRDILEKIKSQGGNWIAKDADDAVYWYEHKPALLDNYVGRWDNPTGSYGRVGRSLPIGYKGAVNIIEVLDELEEIDPTIKSCKGCRWIIDGAYLHEDAPCDICTRQKTVRRTDRFEAKEVTENEH